MTKSSNSPALLKDWLAQASSELQDNGIASSKLDSQLLAALVLNKERTWLHAHPEHKLPEAQQQELDKLLARRLKHEPMAYILGSKEFYGRDFIVTPEVLVPRPESENFIELVKYIEQKNLRFIDIGTGSGILAVTIALEKPSWTGVATDISPGALKVAQQNAQKLKTQNLVFKVQNLLTNDHQNYDLVIANLPYVPKNLRGKADIAREPEIALFADHHGLAMYEELFAQIAQRAPKPTHILTESLLDQHRGLAKMAAAAGYKLAKTQGLVQHFKPAT